MSVFCERMVGVDFERMRFKAKKKKKKKREEKEIENQRRLFSISIFDENSISFKKHSSVCCWDVISVYYHVI